jgi:hypothetical protein
MSELAEGARLEIACTAKRRYRGFESLSLRQIFATQILARFFHWIRPRIESGINSSRYPVFSDTFWIPPASDMPGQAYRASLVRNDGEEGFCKGLIFLKVINFRIRRSSEIQHGI